MQSVPVRPAVSHIAWTSPKIDRRQTPGAGWTLVAVEPIAKGDLILVWGGVILTTEQLYKTPIFARDRAIQVDEDHHLCSGLVDDIADCANHSCNPNAGLRGQITLVAMRDITADEEVCFDYAMSDSHPEFSMRCFCGQLNCRSVITGDDWKLPELQARYDGYFMPYLQRRIDQVRNRSKSPQ